MQIWTATAKLLQSLLDQQRTVEIPYLGKFLQRDAQTLFTPTLELLTAGHFKLEENEYCVSPLSKQVSKFAVASVISLTSISATCGCDREQAAMWLKRIFTEFIRVSRAGKFV